MVFGVSERVAPCPSIHPSLPVPMEGRILRWSCATEKMSRVARAQQIAFLSTLQMDILIYQKVKDVGERVRI